MVDVRGSWLRSAGTARCRLQSSRSFNPGPPGILSSSSDDTTSSLSVSLVTRPPVPFQRQLRWLRPTLRWSGKNYVCDVKNRFHTFHIYIYWHVRDISFWNKVHYSANRFKLRDNCKKIKRGTSKSRRTQATVTAVEPFETHGRICKLWPTLITSDGRRTLQTDSIQLSKCIRH